MFSKEELNQIRERGSDPEVASGQMNRFIEGFPFSELIRPATPGDGIKTPTIEEKKALAALFDREKSEERLCRFVPASGAATRMFKALFSLRDQLEGKSGKEQERVIAGDAQHMNFFESLKRYPFYPDLGLQGDETPADILDLLLTSQGLDYGDLPKGLLKFHRYGETIRTAFEEHLHEAAKIAQPMKEVNLHFTVSEEHLEGFRELERSLVPELEQRYGVQFEITWSFQKRETDTIAVDPENKPFRDEAGKLVFRPGGHGALLENLNDLRSGIIFINNIDNVSTDRNSDLRILHKKMLGGALISARHELFSITRQLENGQDEEIVARGERWLTGEANESLPGGYENWDIDRRSSWVSKMLDRPLRVCGMVKNEGEPGGGPFFTRDKGGRVSLQIVETSQVDMDDRAQVELLGESTHFNPVDLVCSVRRADGSFYELSEYVDADTGFISRKSVKGRELKALELPGLWNGSMAGWNTIFMEIPAEAFTPVKTVFDLLREGHLA